VPARVDAVPSIVSPPGQAEMEIATDAPSKPAEAGAPADPAQTPADIQAGLPEQPALPQMIEAKIIERVEPIYPPVCETNAAPVEVIVVGFTVTPNGNVVSERVTRSRNPCFENAALNAVRRWRFEPRTIDGVPSPAYEQRVTLEFKRPS
jgi:protein TonB